MAKTETRNLFEAASLVSESASEDGTWKVRLISEGKGSSGVYTASLLENHYRALDEVLSFKNHPVGWDGPETRDFTMIAGEIVGQTWLEKDERGLTAVYGNYRPDPEYKDKIERYKDKLGLSIYIEGSGYLDENNDFIVDWLNPADPYASLDVVIAAGARGRFEESMKNYYAHRRAESKTTTTAVEERKDDNMDKELLEALAAIKTTLESLVAEKTSKAEESAQHEADAKAVEAAVAAYDAAVKLIDEADLLEPQVAALRAEALKGADVAPLIESAKAIKDAAVEAAKADSDESTGRTLGERKVESAVDLGKVFG